MGFFTFLKLPKNGSKICPDLKILVATQTQKQKYDTSKVLNLISTVDHYNDIGIKDNESGEKMPNGYKTRQTGAQTQEKQENVAIDKVDPMQKKKIVVPDYKNTGIVEAQLSDHTKAINEKKVKTWEDIESKKGYIRIFRDNTLPKPDSYEAGKDDLKFLEELNPTGQGHKDQRVRDEFATIIIIWEEETGKEDLIISEEKSKFLVANFAKLLSGNLPEIYAVNFMPRLTVKISSIGKRCGKSISGRC